MTAIIVYSRDTARHRYNILQDEDSEAYYLMVDDTPYKENRHLFTGPFEIVLEKLQELADNEDLKTFS